MKKELFELKRNMRIELCNITKITGYIVDNDRNCRLEFVKNFLNLEETETFKYLDIFKKVLSGKPGRNMFQLDFEGKTRKQHLSTIVKTGLEDNDVRQIFLEEIAESIDISNKGYSLILIASGIYDIPGIATDGADLDESEEVYEYMIGCICPVSLSAAGLSYKPELADIQERTRDWVVSMPTQGFLYPAFTDRHGDPEHVVELTAENDAGNIAYCTKMLLIVDPATLCVRLVPLDYMVEIVPEDCKVTVIPEDYAVEAVPEQYQVIAEPDPLFVEVIYPIHGRGCCCE